MAGLVVPAAGSLPAGFQDLFNFFRFNRIQLIIPGASPGQNRFQRFQGLAPFTDRFVQTACLPGPGGIPEAFP